MMDIFKAIKKENLEQIKSILSTRNIEIDIKKHGETPLHIAAITGNPHIIKILLDLGADVNIQTSDVHRKSPLHLACKHCCLQGVALILKSGADVDIKDHYGNTPLYKACGKGRLPIAKLLLQYGATVNLVNNNFMSPLHVAASHGHQDLVKMLLESGCDKFLETKNGETAYMHAVKNKHADIAKLILAFNLVEFQHLSKTFKTEDNFLVQEDINCNSEYFSYESIKTNLKALNKKLSIYEDSRDELKQVLTADQIQLKKAQEAVKHAEIRCQHTEEELKQLNKQILVLSAERSKLSDEMSDYAKKKSDCIYSIDEDVHFFECPICFDVPLPPTKIYQCEQGHIYCGKCKMEPKMTLCPQCRMSIAGQSIRCRHMENLISKKFC